MLIKKTIVLTDGVNAIGHLSIIRVGNETGAKLTLAKPYDGLQLAIKMGNKAQENYMISGLKSEYVLKGMVEPNDQIGVKILGENGMVASGGIREIVSEKSPYFEENIAQSENAKTSNIEQLKTDNKEPIIAENEREIGEIQEPKEVENTDQEQAEIVQEKVVESIKSNPDTAKDETLKVEQKEEDKSSPIITPFKSIKGENFYRNVKGKLNEIMTVNPREKKLEELIPDSKWVRVYYDKGEYYVVGILTEDGEVTFLAYGVPGVKRVKPPKDAEELCDFVEVESSIGEGYWIMFQNAKNGEIVKSL